MSEKNAAHRLPGHAAHDFETIRAALAELVELKDIAYRVENRAQFDIDKDRAREMEREYKKRRPLAWEAARAALKNAAPQELPAVSSASRWPTGEGSVIALQDERSTAGAIRDSAQQPAGAAPETSARSATVAKCARCAGTGKVSVSDGQGNWNNQACECAPAKVDAWKLYCAAWKEAYPNVRDVVLSPAVLQLMVDNLGRKS